MQKKSNILLVVPRYEVYGIGKPYVMPMGMLYVSAYLKRSHVANVYTLNMNHVEGDETDILTKYIRLHNIQVIGVGGLSGEYVDIERMASLSKKIKHDIIVVLGGGVVSGDPLTTMQAIPDADYGVIGEGEQTMVELMEALDSGGDVSQVNGLIYKEGISWHITPQRKEISDLDTLPFPDYEGFDYGKYLQTNPDISDEGKKYSQISVIGGRSCKYNCTFCFHPSGSIYRQRSLDSIFSEIDYLVSHFSVSYVALREELFATDNSRVAEFCRRIENYDFDWSIQLRIDNVNEELVSILRNTRCRYIFIGVESASDEVLKSMHKGVTLNQIEHALAMLREAGLNTRSGVIFGDTVETYNIAMQTLNWYKSNHGRYQVFADMIIAFPGSILYKRACSAGIIPDPVQFLKDGCPIVNLSSMNDEEFAKLIEEVEKMNNRKYNVKYYKKKM